MLLTIAAPISVGDLGYLLYKNPARIHTADLPFGKAHVFYPEPADDRARAESYHHNYVVCVNTSLSGSRGESIHLAR